MSPLNDAQPTPQGPEGDGDWTFSLRLPRQQADLLKAIAATLGVSMSNEIREAVEAHIAKRKADPDFQKRLRASLERNHAILERLRND